MATLSVVSSSSPILAGALIAARPTHPRSLFHSSNRQSRPKNQKPVSFSVHAAKLPVGVEMPKVEPKYIAPLWGFTKTAEIWNSRACMIGLIGTFIVELILNRGILQIIGVDVGKGLDIPL